MWLWAHVRVMVSPSVTAEPGQLQTKNTNYINICPNAAGLEREKIAKTHINRSQKVLK
jgi:hypothetical protein